MIKVTLIEEGNKRRLVDKRLIFATALKANGSCIILATITLPGIYWKGNGQSFNQ